METAPVSARQQEISGLRFVVTAGAWMVGLFALLRLGPVQRFLLLPFAAAQQTVAIGLSGAPRGAVVLDASCSAADVIALCLGVIFAFPAAWRERLRGALLGLLLIAGMNTVRIGHLSLAASDPALLDLLHLYIWPALLTVGVLTYAFVWLRRATKTVSEDGLLRPSWHPGARFLMLATVLTAAYFAAAPWLFASRGVAAAAALVAAATAAVMASVGATVAASGNVLQTVHGPFVVTPECIVTPLIAVYIAAVLAAPLPWGRRAVALLAAPPVFFALGTARLLVLAVPASLISSPTTAVHGFSQVVAGVVLVGGVVSWRRSSAPRWDDKSHGIGLEIPAGLATAVTAGMATAVAAAALWDGIPAAAVAGAQAALGHAGHGLDDPQGALASLPAYQFGLLVALWVAGGRWSSWPRLGAGLVALVASQVAVIAGLGELFHHVGFDAHVVLVRAWAVAAPVVVALVIERPEALIPAPLRIAVCTLSSDELDPA